MASQATSSSSAKTWTCPVRAPCPISLAVVIRVTRPSGAILIQGPSGEASAVCPPAVPSPTANRKAPPALHVMNARRCGAGVTSPAGEHPGPFLDEGGHALLLVLRAEQAVEQAALEVDSLFEHGLEGGVDHFLGRHRRQRRHAGDS